MMLFRKILFYIFLIIYFTATPLLIFYTFGYRIDFKDDQGFVRTGALSLSTAPEGAEVWIDKRKSTQKTPAVILNLREGVYTVEARKTGYQPWINRVEVHAERAVVAEKIILLPAELKSETIAEGPFEQIVPFKEGAWVIAQRGKSVEDLELLDLARMTDVHIAAAMPLAWQKAQVKKIYASFDSTVFWLLLEDGQEKRMLRGRMRFGTLQLEDYSRLFDRIPNKVQWELGAENKVYALYEDQLELIDLDLGAVRKLGTDVEAFQVYKQRLFMSSSRGIFRATAEGENRRALLDDPMLSAELFGRDQAVSFGVYPGGNLLFLRQDGGLFSNRLPYWISRKGIAGYIYDPFNFQALMWTSQKIGLLDFARDNFLREEAFERKLKKRWLYSKGTAIQRVLWIAGGTQAVYLDQGSLYLIETTPGLETRPRFLAKAAEEVPFFYSEGEGRLYFADRESRGLKALSLVPKRELIGEALAKTGISEEGLFFKRTIEAKP